MRLLLLAMTVLAAASASAQTPAPPRAAGGVQRPVDVGPFTPGANGAYQGGGVVLQGAPGAPAPTPQPTPPGQAPANAVPR